MTIALQSSGRRRLRYLHDRPDRVVECIGGTWSWYQLTPRFKFEETLRCPMSVAIGHGCQLGYRSSDSNSSRPRFSRCWSWSRGTVPIWTDSRSGEAALRGSV